MAEGASLEFLSVHFQSSIPDNAFVNHAQWLLCDVEVISVEKVAIVECDEGDFISGIFLIPKKSGGFRPINLNGLNHFIVHRHFKMENIWTVKHLVRKGDWMGKLDLKDAYPTVPIKMAHRKYLRFRWGGRSFEFVSLPFGLSSASWTLTKLLRPLVAFLHRQGIRVVVYLDNILSKAKAIPAITLVRSLLESLGIVISVQKSIFNPS